MSNQGLAVVTGASGGIGYELARLLAADGYPLIIAARSRDKLEAVAHELSEKHRVKVTPLVSDLSQPHSARELARIVLADERPLEILINNAGFGLYGPFAKQPIGQILELLQLNMVSLTELTHAVLPGMIERRRGRIMNVASTAAFQPGPLMAVYFASKAYVLHLSEAIGNELRGSGVSITTLCPGPTTTGFEDRAEMRESKLFSARRLMDAETVARYGYRAMRQARSIAIPGVANRLLAWGTRLAPRSMLPEFARWGQERK